MFQLFISRLLRDCTQAVDFTIQAQIAAEERGETMEPVITGFTLERAFKCERNAVLMVATV